MRLIGVLAIIINFFALSACAYEDNENSAKSFIQDNANKVLKIVDSNGSDQSKSTSLTDIFSDVVDIDWMSKFVLAQHWNGLNNSQKVDYMKAYRKYIISSYVPLFREYNGQKFALGNVTSVGKSQYVVNTLIKHDNAGGDINVAYRVKFQGGSFKVKDIIAEDVSMINTQRSDFSSIINSQGYNALINNLKEKS